MLIRRKSINRSVLGIAALALASVGASAEEAGGSKSECRDGRVFEIATGRPVLDPATQEQLKCASESREEGLLDNKGLMLVGGAVVTAGVVGGLAASGAFSGGNSQPLVPFVPSSVSGR